jgi:hypothetical protein
MSDLRIVNAARAFVRAATVAHRAAALVGSREGTIEEYVTAVRNLGAASVVAASAELELHEACKWEETI